MYLQKSSTYTLVLGKSTFTISTYSVMFTIPTTPNNEFLNYLFGLKGNCNNNHPLVVHIKRETQFKQSLKSLPNTCQKLFIVFAHQQKMDQNNAVYYLQQQLCVPQRAALIRFDPLSAFIQHNKAKCTHMHLYV